MTKFCCSETPGYVVAMLRKVSNLAPVTLWKHTFSSLLVIKRFKNHFLTLNLRKLDLNIQKMFTSQATLFFTRFFFLLIVVAFCSYMSNRPENNIAAF